MKNRFALASIGALVGLAACSDSPVAPSATPVLTKPSFVIDQSPITPVAGQVWVCKVWLGDVGGAPAVATTANPVRSTLTLSNAAIANLAPGAAGCLQVAASTASNQDANAGWDSDFITVTETLDAGTQFVSGKVFFSGGQATETFNSTTRAQEFNTYHGAVIVFENAVIPSTGCTYTKGWYRNNGSNTIIAVDGRTVGQQQQIFDATPGKPGNVTWGSDNNNLNLYQQLLAALNNLDGNATAGPAAVDAAVAAALAATSGSGTSIVVAAGTDVSGLISVLSAFNEGEYAGWPHCD